MPKKEKLWFFGNQFHLICRYSRGSKGEAKGSEIFRKRQQTKCFPPLTDSEVDELYRKGQLGSETPEAMLNTLWVNNTTHFGMWGGKEHRDLCWGDIQLKEDISDGEAMQYLEYTERQIKTRTGENPRDIRPVKPRMYENENKERCPVQLYKAFSQRRLMIAIMQIVHST